jgi:phospholipid/cholesterol/gamma-HCH transport system ATP-binding protein
VIIGGSGTGKSVTLRHMLGLEAPDAGRVIVEDEDITDLPEEELYRVRKKFGMLFQSGALFDSMTVFENVAFPLREHTDMSDDEIGRAVKEKLELVNLPNTAHLMPVDLSGGMRKRVGLARAIVGEPQILLYDEPVTGLDPVNAVAVDRLITDIAERTHVTSIVVTHDVEGALEISDRVSLLEGGTLRFLGTPDEFRRSDDPLVRAFADRKAAVAAALAGSARSSRIDARTAALR